MGGVKDQQWIQASDDVVRERLSAALRRAQAAASPAEVLGSPSADQLRSVFLTATKTYHPNRFARRPDDIRHLAGEVFMLLKEAYEQAAHEQVAHDQVPNKQVAHEASHQRLTEARAKAASGKAKAPRRRGATTRPPDNSAARQELMKRRRTNLKNRLGGTGKRTAQIRAATDAAVNAEASQREEEARFERALNLMKRSDIAAAAAAFKELATGCPVDKRYRMHMHYAQGRVQQSLGQIEEARAEYKRALGLDAEFAAAHQAMSSLPNENKKRSILTKIFGK